MAHTQVMLTNNTVLQKPELELLKTNLETNWPGWSIAISVREPTETIKIETDHSPSNPRVDHDNVGVMYCEHGRYELGDRRADDPRTLPKKTIAISAPIYLYDHSGLTVSHGAFSCQWDSGQIGMHYITVAKADKEWGKGKWTIKQLENLLKSELEIYDHYLQGNVWGYVIEDEDGETTDSCWGFYGNKLDKTGILENIPDDLHDKAKKAWEDRYDA